MSPITRTIVIALAFCAALAPAAAASPNQISIMMDDDLLLYNGDDVAARSLATMKSLGVDTVRVTVLWRNVGENANLTNKEISKLKRKKDRLAAKRQRKRFKPADPRTYPTQNWDRFDNLVSSAATQGIRVYFNVTGPGPAYAHRTPPKKLRKRRSVVTTYEPKVRAFKQFVTAVGKRYSGEYRDENGSRQLLPRVSFWSLWNEPNQGGWLTPQWEKRGKYMVAKSPEMFRKLYLYGYEGLVASGHRVDNDVILLGETAPLGSRKKNTTSAMAPKVFLRELFCQKSNGKPYTGRSASIRGCKNFDRKGPFKANGFAHHPYTKNVAPNARSSNGDAITMANIGELGTMLDGFSADTGNVPNGLALFMTEFGFETNPPDPHSGVPLDQQAKFNTLGEYMAYKDPRIAAQAQFLLADVPPIKGRKKGSKGYWFTYQSGLFGLDGKPKPAAEAYRFPFRVIPTGISPSTATPAYRIWGQLRFRRNGVADNVILQWRAKTPGAAWQTVTSDTTINPLGYFEADVAAPAPAIGEWRAVWLNPDGSGGVGTPGADGS